MQKIKKSIATASAALLLATGITAGVTATGIGIPEAQAASCTATLRAASGGWSRANTCSWSMYRENINGKWKNAAKAGRGKYSQFTACYVGYRGSGMTVG